MSRNSLFYAAFLTALALPLAAHGQPNQESGGGEDGFSGDFGGEFGGAAAARTVPKPGPQTFEIQQEKKRQLVHGKQVGIFLYQLGSLRPTKRRANAGASGMGGMGGMDMEDFGAGESGGSGKLGTSRSPRHIEIRALRVKGAKDQPDSMVLVVPPGDAQPFSERGYGMGGDEMMGMDMEMGMDAGMGMGIAGPHKYVAFETLIGRNLGSPRFPQTMPEAEIKIVGDTIRQLLNRESLVADIRLKADAPDFLRQAEPKLKQLLAETYDTQIARQRYEIDQITAKVKLLQTELARREAARERVVEIQTGRIVLEAQGLLTP